MQGHGYDEPLVSIFEASEYQPQLLAKHQSTAHHLACLPAVVP